MCSREGSSKHAKEQPGYVKGEFRGKLEKISFQERLCSVVLVTGLLKGMAGICFTAVLTTGSIKWVPCHHSMARPQVADGGGLQIWSIAANILNKQSQTVNKG
jgi:hypothetical protein